MALPSVFIVFPSTFDVPIKYIAEHSFPHNGYKRQLNGARTHNPLPTDNHGPIPAFGDS
jgi:hypothetical protein